MNVTFNFVLNNEYAVVSPQRSRKLLLLVYIKLKVQTQGIRVTDHSRNLLQIVSGKAMNFQKGTSDMLHIIFTH